jgi:hypothetical protein
LLLAHIAAKDLLDEKSTAAVIEAPRKEMAGMGRGAMSNVRNWASAAVVAGLVLLAPIIAFVVVIAVEMLGDLMARAGAPAIWPVVAGAMAWVLLRKFGGQPHASRLGSEGA